MDEEVTISKAEYLQLRKANVTLEYLTLFGVECWEGYDNAIETMKMEKEWAFLESEIIP